MAAKPQESLDALQLLLNEALVQTGKALRASRRDSQGNLTQPPALAHSKIPDTIRAFHTALDDLESNIVQAKSVLQRDLNQARATKPLPPKKELASPINIEMTSPPQPPALTSSTALPDIANGVADESTPKVETKDATVKDETKTEEQPNQEPDTSLGDMGFAPPDDQTQPTDNQFDLTTFAPTENVADMLSLDMLPTVDKPDETKKEDETAATATTAAAPPEAALAGADTELSAMIGDSGATDGMDFDFSIGGTGEETFDDLMNTRDDTFELMDNDFDDAFFGLDGQNN